MRGTKYIHSIGRQVLIEGETLLSTKYEKIIRFGVEVIGLCQMVVW